ADHRVGPAGDLAPVHAVQQDRHGQRGHLLVGDRAAREGVDHPVDLGIGQLTAVALGDDDLDDVHHDTLDRSSGPNAYGRISAIRLGPSTVSTSSSAPPNSHSSWRQRPHGMSSSPWPSTQVKATSRPPPEACSADTSPHSAHNPSPYEAFSTLQPVTTRPSSTSAAAPTGNFEYGA